MVRRQLTGTLCPNPVVSDGLRLDERLGNRFALVSSIPPDTAQRAHLAHRGAALHITDAGSVLGEWLRRGHATAAIVRPDRTVMRAGRDIAKLCVAIPSFTVDGSESSA